MTGIDPDTRGTTDPSVDGMTRTGEFRKHGEVYLWVVFDQWGRLHLVPGEPPAQTIVCSWLSPEGVL